MNWKIKSLVRQAFTALPGGHRLYRWTTARLLGMQAGMAHKWFRVFPAHIAVMEKYFGSGSRDVSMWCFNCGATPAPAYAMALTTDCPGLLTDQDDRLTGRYLAVSRQLLEEKGPQFAARTHAPAERLSELLAKAPRSGDPVAAMAAMGMTYSSNHRIALEAPWRGTIGLMFTAGTMEHYTPEQLEDWIDMVKQAMRPDGVLSHVMDHRDHRWHADKTISPLLQYTLSDEAFRQVMGNTLDYHNRWFASDWVRFFEKHGYEVETITVIPYTADLVQTERAQLAPAYRDAPESDLKSLVTHFIAKRKAGAETTRNP
jgi:hypothetical protein